jgi:hypothetical protein
LTLLGRQDFSSVAVYDGAGAFLDLLKSDAAVARRTANRLVAALCPATRR